MISADGHLHFFSFDDAEVCLEKAKTSFFVGEFCGMSTFY